MRVPSACGLAAAALFAIVSPTFGVLSEAVHRINCGGADFVDSEGKQWVTDYGYGGAGIGKGIQIDPTTAILEDPQSDVYLSERYCKSKTNELTYTLPVTEQGTYLVRLFFVDACPCTYTNTELYGTLSYRNFHIDINGIRAIANYDIIRRVGWGKPVVQEFLVHTTAAAILVGLRHGTVENPTINGIEVIAIDTSTPVSAESFEVVTLAPTNTPTLPPTTSAPSNSPTRTPTVTTRVPTKAPTTKAPTTRSPTTNAPVTNAPTTAAPTTQAPTTPSPTTVAPSTEHPTTGTPTTETPTTAAPTTSAPVTNAPTTLAPTTAAPTTSAPTSEAPSTASPSTASPTTASPTTAQPTTASPSTGAPLPTVGEITSEQPTEQPTTAQPTSSSPTSSSPTSSSPTSSSPTSSSPTSSSPTSSSPTTAQPTTSSPSTQSPTAVIVTEAADAGSNNGNESDENDSSVGGKMASVFRSRDTSIMAGAGLMAIIAAVLVLAAVWRRRQNMANRRSGSECDLAESLPALEPEWDDHGVRTTNYAKTPTRRSDSIKMPGVSGSGRWGRHTSVIEHGDGTKRLISEGVADDVSQFEYPCQDDLQEEGREDGESDDLVAVALEEQDDEHTSVASPPCEITLHHNFGESETTDHDDPFTLSSSHDRRRSCTADDDEDVDEYDNSTLPMTNQFSGVRDSAHIINGSSGDNRTSTGGVNRVMSDLTSHLSSSAGTTITTTSSKRSAPLAAPFEYVDRFKATPRIRPPGGEKPIISTRLFPDGQSSFGSEVA